jgi:hydroxymethylbilane synthase
MTVRGDLVARSTATPAAPDADPIRIGTRASDLARTQSKLVADAVTAGTGRTCVLVPVTTTGDISTRPLSEIGGTGVFVTALRTALLAGEVDVAVHSLKDLPTAPAPELVVAAVPAREDPRDALVAGGRRRLVELPARARVGTGSPRRAAQLRALRDDLDVVDIRGNVDTRVRKVADGEVDAVVLARAGLARLGRLAEISEVLEPERMLPAPGQGALAVECRAGDGALADLLEAALESIAARVAVTAERSLLGALEAGCTAPVGALAELSGDRVRLRAVAADLEGRTAVHGVLNAPAEEAADLGRRLADQMLADGAADLVAPRPRSVDDWTE